MSRNDRQRINTAESSNLGQNPFASLNGAGLPAYPEQAPVGQHDPDAKPESPKLGGRIEVRREKAGRGGKTVTLVRPLKSVREAVLEALANNLKRHLGCGGGVEGDKVVIQGAQVDPIVAYLKGEGWNAFAAN